MKMRRRSEHVGGRKPAARGAAAPAPAQRKDRRDVAEQRNCFCTASHHREASGAFPRPNCVVKGLLKVRAQVRCCSEAFLLIRRPLWPRGVASAGFRHECLRSAFWIIPPCRGHISSPLAPRTAVVMFNVLPWLRTRPELGPLCHPRLGRAGGGARGDSRSKTPRLPWVQTCPVWQPVVYDLFTKPQL